MICIVCTIHRIILISLQKRCPHYWNPIIAGSVTLSKVGSLVLCNRKIIIHSQIATLSWYCDYSIWGRKIYIYTWLHIYSTIYSPIDCVKCLTQETRSDSQTNRRQPPASRAPWVTQNHCNWRQRDATNYYSHKRR